MFFFDIPKTNANFITIYIPLLYKNRQEYALYLLSECFSDNCLPPHPFPLLVHIHAPVEFLLHLVKEVGAAVVLAQFEVGIDAVAVFRLHIEQRVEEGGKFADWYLTVIDTPHLCHTVEDFNKVGGFARPAQGSGGLHHLVMIVQSGLRI